MQQAPSYIVNTHDYIEKVDGKVITEDETLVSFDVKSLFTSVPVRDAIAVIGEIIQADEDFENRTKITSTTLVELLEICLSSTSFRFRGEHYEHTDGLTMGSPVSPAVANIFMASLEERALKTFAHSRLIPQRSLNI